MFEDMDAELQTTEQGAADGEVKAMQEFLRTNGFYNDEIDGWFGPVTSEALKCFQTSVGLPPTGCANADTKKIMVLPKFDQTKPGKSIQPRKRGEKLTYWVGDCPGHLDHDQVLREVQAAWNKWGAVTGTTWKRIESWDDSDVEILWHDQHYHSELKKQGDKDVSLNEGDRDNLEIEFNFDGPGAQLGHSGFDFLHLDANEEWLTSDMRKTHPTQFIVYNVVLHEIGHVLGLEHSKSPGDLMGPFYADEHKDLSAGDIVAIKTVYPEVEAKSDSSAESAASGSSDETLSKCSSPNCTCTGFAPQKWQANKCHVCLHWENLHLKN
jgi:peptidoglycan hydrolase-like protein with peptidoglycan-binding domain